MKFKEYVISDAFRYIGRTPKFLDFFSLFFRNFGFRVTFFNRLYHCNNKSVKFLAKLLNFLLGSNNVQLPLNCTIGYGLYIGHNGPIIINQSAKIGNNVNLSQFTTIGSNYSNAATIGDNVYIGPSVCIIENVHIGNNATIGAGSVVTKDIPENATAVGNYAKVINFKEPGIFIHNKYIPK